MSFTQLVTVCSGLLRLCMKMYTMFRSLLYHKMFVNFRCWMYCIYKKCSFQHKKVEEEPNKKPKKDGDKDAVAVLTDVRQLGCVHQDTEPPQSSSILRKSQDSGPIRRVRFTRATLRQANIREKEGPSLGKVQVKIPHQHSPYALKFEDRSQDETERQERCARGDAWRLAKNISTLEEKDIATFYSLSEIWCLPAPSVIKPKKREFVKDSGASVQQERPELCRMRNRKGPQKSDDGCCSQRRSANKRRGNNVCQSGFIRESNASRGRSLTWKTLRKSWV